MLVYRLETVTGRGPYNCYFSMTGCYTYERHPGPDEDGIDSGELTKNDFFGFRSLTQLNDWFDRELRANVKDQMRLGIAKGTIDHKEKLYISVYDVPPSKVIEGNRQLVFERRHASLIRRKELLSMEDVFSV